MRAACSPLRPQHTPRRKLTRVSELPALAAFYSATGGPNWLTKTNWMDGGFACTGDNYLYPDARFYGVSACSRGEIQDLELDSNSLVGTLPTQVGALTSLSYHLIASKNSLSGTLPTQLGQLSKLRAMWLDNNKISGTLPTELINLSNLHTMYAQRSCSERRLCSCSCISSSIFVSRQAA